MIQISSTTYLRPTSQPCVCAYTNPNALSLSSYQTSLYLYIFSLPKCTKPSLNCVSICRRFRHPYASLCDTHTHLNTLSLSKKHIRVHRWLDTDIDIEREYMQIQPNQKKNRWKFYLDSPNPFQNPTNWPPPLNFFHFKWI